MEVSKGAALFCAGVLLKPLPHNAGGGCHYSPQMYYAAQYLSQCYRSVGQGTIVGPGQNVPVWIYTHRFIINLYNLPNLLGQEYTPPEDDNIIYIGILPLSLLIIYLARHKSLLLS